MLRLERDERPRGDAPAKRVLKPDELSVLFAHASERFVLPLKLAAFTGLRASELPSGGLMDVGVLLRLKGMCEAALDAPTKATGQAVAASYVRIRAEVGEAIGGEHTEELDRLFPKELETAGRPWGIQAEEAKTLFGQLAGWISGLIEEQLLDRRIRAEAEAKARKTGFG